MTLSMSRLNEMTRATVDAHLERDAFRLDLARRLHIAKHRTMSDFIRKSGFIPELLSCDDCGKPYAEDAS